MNEKGSSGLKGLFSADSPSNQYDREPSYRGMIQQCDVMVRVRDGVSLCVDIYRPDAPGKFPALLAFAEYNKDLQTPALSEAVPPQPAWSHLWTGPMEAGDTRFFVSRGYAHIITSLDLPAGVAGATNTEYIPYHICSSKTTVHRIYHNEKYPSYSLLPLIRGGNSCSDA